MSQRGSFSFPMKISRAIDSVSLKTGELVAWLVIVAILISAGNAISRKFFSLSSNAWLEAQWYLFGATFMLSAARVMVHDKHVRVDLIFQKLSRRGRLWIDLLGHLFFLLPLCVLMLIYGIPFAVTSFQTSEISINPGGLIVWPAKMLIPLGFALLLAQGISEIIKRFCALFAPEQLLDSANVERDTDEAHDL
jgi:TRAP-type mannitol/chloroaromatic compound transport system permease small subunit